MEESNLTLRIHAFLMEASRVRNYDLGTSVSPDLREQKKEVLQGKIAELRRAYGEALTGTPEEEYLHALQRNYLPAVPEYRDLYKRVGEMEWSPRVEHCFRSMEIEYIGELVQRSEAELLTTKNFGRKSIQEVKRVLAAMGLQFEMELDDWVPPPREFP